MILPPEFDWLRTNYVQRWSNTEWSAACPRCGGEPHPNGEWPDRLRIFLDEPLRVWCRHCGWFTTAREQRGGASISEEEKARFRTEQIAYQEARKRSAELALRNLSDNRLWETLHNNLDKDARAWWRKRGIPDSMQDFWRLGWNPDLAYWHKRESQQGPAASIPIFAPNWEAVDIKYRLINPPSPTDKYRATTKGQSLFLANPDASLDGHLIVVEGEIKAMVTALKLGDMNIVGLPSKSPSRDIIDLLKKADRITLVIDPDAKVEAYDLALEIGKHKVRGVRTPMKIDDGILAANLDDRDVLRLLDSARPA
jgi:hypothetical protein